MAISERSQGILDLLAAYNVAKGTQDKVAVSKDLKKSLQDLIDVQLHDKQLLATAKRAKFTLAQLKTELLESVEGDVLRLCEEVTMQKSARDVVKEHLIIAASNLQDRQIYERDAENQQLVTLLQAYRLSKQGKRELNELYPVLNAKMLKISEHLVRVYNLPLENANEAINLVFDKWLSHPDGLLYDWSPGKGAAVSSWIYKALNWRMLDLRRKAKQYNEDESESALIRNLPYLGKTQSSLIRIGQLESRFEEFIDSLEEGHAEALSFRLKDPEITDWQLGEKLGLSKSTAGRRKLEVEAYIAAHGSSAELLELLKPCGRG